MFVYSLKIKKLFFLFHIIVFNINFKNCILFYYISLLRTQSFILNLLRFLSDTNYKARDRLLIWFSNLVKY